MKGWKLIKVLSSVLLFVGGINWALFVFGVDLVKILTFGFGWLANVVYFLVGVSAFIHFVPKIKTN